MTVSRERSEYFRIAQLSARLPRGARETDWDERDSAELTALLAQYESLRTESMNTVNNRTQILMLGLAAIITMAAGALALAGGARTSLLHLAAFCYGIPLVCSFVLLVWLSEAVRSHRAGYFLASSVEARINALLGRLVMNWETSLWVGLMPRDEKWGPSMMALALVGLIALFAPLVGVILAGWSIRWNGGPLQHVWIPYAFLLTTAAYVASRMGSLVNIPQVRSQDMPADASSLTSEGVDISVMTGGQPSPILRRHGDEVRRDV